MRSMGIEHVKNRKKICALMMAMLLTGWLSGCSGNDVEAMADSVSEDDIPAEAAEEMPGTISENDAAGSDDILGNVASGSEAISENSVPGGGTVADDGEAEDTRPDPVKVKGIYVSGPVAGTAKMDDLIDLVDCSIYTSGHLRVNSACRHHCLIPSCHIQLPNSI